MEANNKELINKVKDFIKEEISTISYQTWFNNLDIYDIKNSQVILSTPTSFQKEILETKYFDLISNTFKYFTNCNNNITIISLDSIKETNNEISIENNYQYMNTFLNSSYTFETFIVGDNNNFANAAALAVVESPRKSL